MFLLGLTLPSMNAEQIDPERAGFGQRLKAAREWVDMTQDDVAKKFGVNKATVSAWETGRGDPGVFRLRELAKLYKRSAEGLLWSSAPSNEAMQLAAEFDSLTEKQKSTLRALWMAYISESSDDAAVEQRMPITQRAKESRQ